MTDITIDLSLCTGCGLCASLCSYCIIEMKADSEKASVNSSSKAFCSRCGHCSAICPEGAICVDYDGAGPVPHLEGDSYPTIGQMNRLITMRRSIRSYKDKKVPRETLEEILNVVRYAPTGMNGQSVHWMVIEDSHELRKLVDGIVDWARELVRSNADNPLMPILPMFIAEWERGIDHICHGAPHLVIAYAHKDNPIGLIDCTIALTHLDLLAPVYGLGTCWAGIVQIALDSSPSLMKQLGLPEGFKSIYGMMIGYPKYQYKRAPKRNALDVIWK
ncbi:MAG: 4Fe-4S binding protein [Methanomicrobiales archaeon]|nr:4Fe-4S binding protein [Methanomicrobiales archaeon]